MDRIIYYCCTLILCTFPLHATAVNKFNLEPTKLPLINFYAEQYPPANYMDGDELVGITVDSLKLMWADLGVTEQEISIVPWNRGYRNALKSPNTALFTMSRTPAREALFKWVGPLFKSVHVLMAKKSANIKVDNLGDVLSYRVATIQGDISEISLQQIGFPDFNMAKVQNLERAFVMMQSGRVDMMMVSVHGFQHLTRLLNVDSNKYEQVWQVNEIGNYIAFNVETSDKVIEAYQQALDNVAEQRILVKQKYKLPQIEY